jgi:hypothetical protein
VALTTESPPNAKSAATITTSFFTVPHPFPAQTYPQRHHLSFGREPERNFTGFSQNCIIIRAE